MSLNELNILSLHEEQHYALDKFNDFKGVILLTGKAGTGKSTLFNLFNKITSKKTVVLAPTGIAAINVGGQTIHSFFKLPPFFVSSKDYRPISKSLIKKIDLIVIDEISMVRADILDHIDQILKISTSNNAPFGGIPMLWIGDLYQLPPIVSTVEEREYFKNNYSSPYFFSSKVMSDLKEFEIIELSQVFRQSELRFIKLLNKIRINEIDEDDLLDINERFLPITQSDDNPTITLSTTNAIANQINMDELAKLSTTTKVYQSKISGKISTSQMPNELQLILKLGAQVMTIRNSPDKAYVNGSIGIIEELGDDFIKVKFTNPDSSVKVNYENWDIIRYVEEKNELKKEIIATFSQLPVRLAWAVTIHKSQGKSFDRLILDLGRGAFETGQAYVALSRCRNLEGLFLKQKLSWRDIQTDHRVSEFLRKYL
ncbi:MAG: DEAD/DEAH box helicase [Saprospiraceae bacterium]